MLKYGVNWPDGLGELDIELTCMGVDRRSENGGLGAYRHWKNAARLAWPHLQIHDWMQWRAQTFFENDYNFWVGCATAGKSHDGVGPIGLLWWLANPAESAVVLTSTTAKSIRRRLWPVLQEYRNSLVAQKDGGVFAHGFPCHVIDSKTLVQAVKGDDKHAIAAIAVAEGSVTKAVSDIKGFHPKKRLLVIVDEANDTPEAIFHAISNLKKGLVEFKMIVIGNPISRLDPHGRVCEPVNGWNSINENDEEWQTAGVKEWEIEPGICLHFDGEKSPNIKLGRDEYTFLYSNKNLRDAREACPNADTLGYWSNTRGFWAPDGVCNTVFTDSFVVKHGLKDLVIFASQMKMLAGLDPSFSADGDGCILRFGKMGDLPYGRMCLLVTDRVKINLKSGEDIFYQVAEKTVEECKKRGLEPDCLGIDTTGGGTGIADIIARIWGPGQNRVGFGERASEKPASQEDNRPSHEVYSDRVTELWYNAREFGSAGQLKGLNVRDCLEFCSRPFTIKNKKIEVLPKKECKKELGRSPDDADGVVVLLDTARKHGLLLNKPKLATAVDQKTWERKAKELNNQVYEEAA